MFAVFCVTVQIRKTSSSYSDGLGRVPRIGQDLLDCFVFLARLNDGFSTRLSRLGLEALRALVV